MSVQFFIDNFKVPRALKFNASYYYSINSQFNVPKEHTTISPRTFAFPVLSAHSTTKQVRVAAPHVLYIIPQEKPAVATSQIVDRCAVRELMLESRSPRRT